MQLAAVYIKHIECNVTRDKARDALDTWLTTIPGWILL